MLLNKGSEGIPRSPRFKEMLKWLNAYQLIAIE